MYLLWAENSRKLPLAPSLLLQYWLSVSMQPPSYRLQVRRLTWSLSSACSGRLAPVSRTLGQVCAMVSCMSWFPTVSQLRGRCIPIWLGLKYVAAVCIVQMVLGHAQCQMAFYVQQKAFELPRPRPNQPAPHPDRPANVGYSELLH